MMFYRLFLRLAECKIPCIWCLAPTHLESFKIGVDLRSERIHVRAISPPAASLRTVQAASLRGVARNVSAGCDAAQDVWLCKTQIYRTFRTLSRPATSSKMKRKHIMVQTSARVGDKRKFVLAVPASCEHVSPQYMHACLEPNARPNTYAQSCGPLSERRQTAKSVRARSFMDSRVAHAKIKAFHCAAKREVAIIDEACPSRRMAMARHQVWAWLASKYVFMSSNQSRMCCSSPRSIRLMTSK
eukprot:6194071-Pleurochrysis_carterae.AAC.1